VLPRVILHNAVSVDGRMDWLNIDLAQYYGLVPRWRENATLVGAGTILAAPDPVPPEDASAFEPPPVKPRDKRPLLVVPDSRGRVRSWHALRQAPYWRGMVALCSRATPREYRDYLKRRHIDCIITGREQVDLRRALEELNARYGVKVVRVDSGGTLNGALLRAGLISEVSILIQPSLVGGTTPRGLFLAPDLTSAAGVVGAKLAQVEKLKGGVVWLRYKVAR